MKEHYSLDGVDGACIRIMALIIELIRFEKEWEPKDKDEEYVFLKNLQVLLDTRDEITKGLFKPGENPTLSLSLIHI